MHSTCNHSPWKGNLPAESDGSTEVQTEQTTYVFQNCWCVYLLPSRKQEGFLSLQMEISPFPLRSMGSLRQNGFKQGSLSPLKSSSLPDLVHCLQLHSHLGSLTSRWVRLGQHVSHVPAWFQMYCADTRHLVGVYAGRKSQGRQVVNGLRQQVGTLIYCSKLRSKCLPFLYSKRS